MNLLFACTKVVSNANKRCWQSIIPTLTNGFLSIGYKMQPMIILNQISLLHKFSCQFCRSFMQFFFYDVLKNCIYDNLMDYNLSLAFGWKYSHCIEFYLLVGNIYIASYKRCIIHIKYQFKFFLSNHSTLESLWKYKNIRQL